MTFFINHKVNIELLSNCYQNSLSHGSKQKGLQPNPLKPLILLSFIYDSGARGRTDTPEEQDFDESY